MKRPLLLAGMASLVAGAALGQGSNATVGELLAALKTQTDDRTWIVIPIAGSGTGQDGTVFHTDVAVTGSHRYYFDARVAVAFLPSSGRDASEDPVRYLDLPSEFDVSSTTFRGLPGGNELGAIVIAAVDAAGALDPEGAVSANVRVWNASRCAGETSLGYRPRHWSEADRGTIIGLMLGDGFRSNAGIVNADTRAHTWHVRYAPLEGGSGAPVQLEVTVPAASSVISGLPPDVSGPIVVTIEAQETGFPWTAWGASVDNASGDAWYSALVPF